jgi:c-di-AMP phosphodiesterase-like protein
MHKRSKIKELIRSKLTKQIKEGNIKEGWLNSFIDDIFDSAKQSKIKNDPIIRGLKAKLAKETEDYFKTMEKRYKGVENFPEYVRQNLKDVGYPGI